MDGASIYSYFPVTTPPFASVPGLQTLYIYTLGLTQEAPLKYLL